MEDMLEKVIEGLNLPDCRRKILEAAITEYVFYCIRIHRSPKDTDMKLHEAYPEFTKLISDGLNKNAP